MFEMCEFCQKWDFENVNFVKNDALKMWILTKMGFWNCEFCEKWDVQKVIFFDKLRIFASVCARVKLLRWDASRVLGSMGSFIWNSGID